jgi:hypothetical protein
MFDFLKKNNNRNNYYYPNQNPYNYQYNQGPLQIDPNMIDIEIKELKRLINDLNMRINRIEGYIGIRDEKPNVY